MKDYSTNLRGGEYLDSYREIYGLNGVIDDINKELKDMNGIELYALKPIGVSYLEVNADSSDEVYNLDKMCVSNIISYCENKKIDKHSFGPMHIW